MSDAASTHNLLARRFVREIIGAAIKDGATYAELMVIVESSQMAVLEVLNRHYDLTPQVSTGLLEGSLNRAIERFAGGRAKP
ncbi:hypothetical protein [Mesorhizobium sp. LNJC405B00]|uniref:hypothetical protein n=1 Tax=Mesorhizobium sp. LNJC405B00 TaxID=1287281 RepID=UPI0003CE1C6F|nr:hypothetical protein [Mesorhizobium sp. LNJC405B00]ESY02759.1 hypothetical protein X755_01245 [Mesorhizobium sp. LNJC405B00]